MKIIQQSVRLIWFTPSPAVVIEEAGRTCYKSEGNDPYRFIRMLIDRGHESVLEHASASFRIITDRGISHEIVRHRIASYSQESTRYCNYSADRFNNEITFIEPPLYFQCQRDIWEKQCELAEEAYFQLMKNGATPQLARSVLPNSLKTELVMTANFREWRHFLKLRLSNRAHPQIVEISKLIAKQLMHVCYPVFCDFEEML